MIYKRLIFFVLLACFLSVSFSQETSISDAIKKSKITLPDTNSDSLIEHGLNNSLETIDSKNCIGFSISRNEAFDINDNLDFFIANNLFKSLK